MLEDAIVVGERAGLEALFEPGGILVTGGDHGVTCGGPAFEAVATRLSTRQAAYVADAPRVLQARDTALTLATGGVTVARRRAEGWRYAIALLLDSDRTERRAP